MNCSKDTYSLPKVAHFPQTKNFLGKIINVNLIYFLAPFYCAKLKKTLKVDLDL